VDSTDRPAVLQRLPSSLTAILDFSPLAGLALWYRTPKARGYGSCTASLEAALELREKLKSWDEYM
jgi:hypothetical protein